MSTKKVIAIVVLTNLIIVGLLLAFLSTAGVVMAFPPGPQGEVPEETYDVFAVRTRKPTLPHPNYDSGWVKISKGAKKKIVHRLRRSLEDYVVIVGCKDTASKGDGINHNYYGVDSGYGGVTWYGLTTSAIKIFRDKKDDYCDKVRVRIWITGA